MSPPCRRRAPTSADDPALRPLFQWISRGARLAVCIAIACGDFGGCALSGVANRQAAHELGAATWHELKAERFTLLTDGPTAALEAFARDLARYVAVVDEIVHAPPPIAPARFFLLSRETQAIFLDPSQGGFIFTALPGFHSFVRADEHSPIHRHILLHEFTHYLTLRNNSIAYPYWYVEGIAEFLGSTRMRDDMMEVGAAPPGRIAQLESLRASDLKLEIAHVLDYESNPGVEGSMLDYASAWALVHYLNTSGERKAQLSKLLQLQIAGFAWQDAFASTFSESPARLADEISEHTHRIAQGAPDSLLYLDLGRLNVDSDWSIRKLSRSEADLALGEILMLQENHSLAERLFRDAIEQTPDDFRPRAALVEAVAAQGRFDAAQQLIDPIDAETLSQAESLSHLASAIFRQAESMKPLDAKVSPAGGDALFERARGLFERATRLDPRSPVAWAGLARSRIARGDTNGALEAFEKAAATGERDVELMLDWGLAEDRTGHEEAARKLWTIVLRQGNSKQRARAEQLIGELASPEQKAHPKIPAP